MRDDRWNFQTKTGQEDDAPALYDLVADPNEDTNVIAEHPHVADRQRRRVEAVMRQPLPGQHDEMCTRDVKAPAHVCRAIQFGFVDVPRGSRDVEEKG